MDCIVLYTSMGLVILAVIGLHGADGGSAHHAGEIRVLAAGLLAASPPRVTEDIDVRAPERKALVPDAACGLGHSEAMMVGSIPGGTCLVRDGGVDLELLRLVKSSCKADGLRENGRARAADTVAGLAPPVVGGDAETVDRDRAVHHQAHLLLRSQQRDKILNPLVDIEAGVLERILVTLAGGKKHCRGQDKD